MRQIDLILALLKWGSISSPWRRISARIHVRACHRRHPLRSIVVGSAQRASDQINPALRE
jgi:hypothetical protein